MKIFNKIISLSVAIGLLGGLAGGVAGTALAAGKRVALVEQGANAAAGIQEFSLLREGTEFTLGAGETMIIGYMTSCLRETITGGKVTIGAKQSEVAGGKVAREEVKCAEPRLALTADESQESATIAFRGQVKHIFTQTPVLLASKSLRITVTSVEDEKSQDFEPVDGRVDLAAAKLALQPGKTYRIKGDQTVLLEIDPAATAGTGSPLERAVLID